MLRAWGGCQVDLKEEKKSVALYSLLLALLVPVVLTFFCFARLYLVRLFFAVCSFFVLYSSPSCASAWNQRSSVSSVDQVLITYI